jgi:hypothetical protein
MCASRLYLSVRSQLPASSSTRTCKEESRQDISICWCLSVSPLPASEVTATSAAVSRLPAIHPAPRHLCSGFVTSDANFSASLIHRRFSTACRVYADTSDHHSTSYCGTCMKIRFAAPSLLRGFEQRQGILVFAIQQFHLRPSYNTCRGVRRGGCRNFPLHPSYVPGVRGRGGNGRDVTETRRQFLQAAGGPGMWWESQPGLCS